MNIIPAILPKTRNELVEKLQQLYDSGYSGRVQIDMCDGQYVSSTTWPFTELSKERMDIIELAGIVKSDGELVQLLLKFEVDVDLMVHDPDTKMIVWDAFVPDRIIIHLNTLKTDSDIEHLSVLLAGRQGLYDVMNRKAVVFAFSLDTDIEKFDYWYKNFNMRNVQIMCIEHIGIQGEQFSEQAWNYIESLKQRFDGLRIMVDGGVNSSNLKRLSEYGVTDAVAGSSVFKNNDISGNIADLRNVI